MTTEPQSPTEYSERVSVSVRKSLALAAAYGIGPFKKRVRLETPEAEEQYTSITVDLRPPKPVWNYKGKVADKPLEILSAPLYDTDYRQTRTEERVDSFGKYKLLMPPDFHFPKKPQDIEYAFAFSRNGMSYQLRFRNQDRQYAPHISEFTISEMSGLLHQYGGRPMTKQEAEYALSVIEAEYPYDKHDGIMAPYHAEVLDRLRKKLPQYITEAEAEKSNSNSKFMKNENKYQDIKKFFFFGDTHMANSFFKSSVIGTGKILPPDLTI